MFFTPPLVEHAMFFPVKTIFLTFAKMYESTIIMKKTWYNELINSKWDRIKKKIYC